MRERKTIDVWEIQVNYGEGWECECTETNRFSMMINRRAYYKNCQYPIQVVKKRQKKTEWNDLKEHPLQEARAAVEWYKSKMKMEPNSPHFSKWENQLTLWQTRVDARLHLAPAMDIYKKPVKERIKIRLQQLRDLGPKTIVEEDYYCDNDYIATIDMDTMFMFVKAHTSIAQDNQILECCKESNLFLIDLIGIAELALLDAEGVATC